MEVVKLVGDGLTGAEIAEELIEKSVKHWTNGVEAIVVQKGAFKDSRS
jgi:hypothetical protein